MQSSCTDNIWHSLCTVRQIHIGIQNVRNKLLTDDLESSSKFKIERCHPEKNNPWPLKGYTYVTVHVKMTLKYWRQLLVSCVSKRKKYKNYYECCSQELSTAALLSDNDIFLISQGLTITSLKNNWEIHNKHVTAEGNWSTTKEKVK